MTEGPWGRLLIAGGTDFPNLGRKDKTGQKVVNLDQPDLPTPQLIRSVCNIRFKKCITSHSSCHAVFIDVDGQAWLLGRNQNSQLGNSSTESLFTPVPLSSNPNLPQGLLPPRTIVAAATGRAHTLLVTDKGEVYAAGSNSMGQCGQSTGGGNSDVGSWKRVGEGGPLGKEKVVAVSAGVNFSLALTGKGRVYAWGSPEKGQLGNGRTGEYIAASKVSFREEHEPIMIKAFEGKNIVEISCGQQHSLALDSDGFVYSWGFGGLGRLGLGAQADKLLPEIIPQFAGSNKMMRATKIACGSTNSMVLDGQRMLYLFGKWKNSGDGSSGQPWMVPKYMTDLMGYKLRCISAGGVTLFGVAEDDKEGGTITIAWGQNANNGELGLGMGQPKSATKPSRVSPFDEIEVIDISAGQNTTYYLARPPPSDAAPAPKADFNPFDFSAPAEPVEPPAADDATSGVPRSKTDPDKWAEVARFPPALDAADICVVCGVDKGDANAPLECDKCEEPYHLDCLSPPLHSVPPGEWFCPECSGGSTTAEEPEPAPKAKTPKGAKSKAKGAAASSNGASKAPASRKRKAAEEPAEEEGDDGGEEEEEAQEETKTKAVGRGRPAGKGKGAAAAAPAAAGEVKRGRGRPKGSTKKART